MDVVALAAWLRRSRRGCLDARDDPLVVLAERRVKIDREQLEVAEDRDAELLQREVTRTEQVLVVLEHQPLGRVPIQRVVRSAGLEQVVEPAKQPELGLRLDRLQRRAYPVVVKLGGRIAEVRPDDEPLDQIPELGEKVLG